MFRKIERSTWKRDEYFAHYFSDVPCTFQNQCLLPLAVQVHHSVCDGLHLSRFIDELKENIEEIERFFHETPIA